MLSGSEKAYCCRRYDQVSSREIAGLRTFLEAKRLFFQAVDQPMAWKNSGFAGILDTKRAILL